MNKKRSVYDTYNKALLTDPKYTPNRVFNMLAELLYPHVEEVADRTIARVLQIDNCTISHVLNKHIMFSPRMVLTIMDVTGWTREQFNQYSGMRPYVTKPTPEQLEEIRSRKGTVAESVRPPRSGKRAAKRQNAEHTDTREDTDQGSVGLAQRASGVESSNRY